jgi:hypothetical protein
MCRIMAKLDKGSTSKNQLPIEFVLHGLSADLPSKVSSS